MVIKNSSLAKRNTFTGTKFQFALCINNEGYEASLEVGKVYRIIPDEEASAHGYIRIIDESGEDYAFSDQRFHRIDLPDAVGEMLASAQQV